MVLCVAAATAEPPLITDAILRFGWGERTGIVMTPLFSVGRTTLSERIGVADGVVDTLSAFAFDVGVAEAVALVFIAVVET